jgi:hypothetical protein
MAAEVIVVTVLGDKELETSGKSPRLGMGAETAVLGIFLGVGWGALRSGGA